MFCERFGREADKYLCSNCFYNKQMGCTYVAWRKAIKK